MTLSASGALAVELHPVSATRWVATYYPMVATPAGRWAEITWDLHECLIPTTSVPQEPARWLEASSPDPEHPCYAGHRAWSAPLAAGYAQALAVYEAEATEEPFSAQETQLLRDGAFLVPAGQLSEWMLDDLQDETPAIHG